MNPKWWRMETVKKHGLAFSKEADNNSERDVEGRYIGLTKLFLTKVCLENPLLHYIASVVAL